MLSIQIEKNSPKFIAGNIGTDGKINFLTIWALFFFGRKVIASNTAIHRVNNFTEWSINNCMKCNFSKCKEMVFRKKGYSNVLQTVQNLPQHPELCILGVAFQKNCRFSIHAKNKLVAANKCQYILRTRRKEGYGQAELDILFCTLVLP